MDQKTFAALFIVVTILVVMGITISRFLESSNLSPSPSPSFTTQLFGNDATSASSLNAKEEVPSSVPSKTVKSYPKAPPSLSAQQLKNKKAVIETNKGVIEFELNPEATKAASNFIFLATDKFYDGLIFHRVVPGFVIQGGDPLGDGKGGPGYSFEDEVVTKPYKKGIVAMANAGPNTNGSQFFIMLEDKLDLPPNYTIFGNVTKGMDVVSSIAVGDVMRKVTISNK